jgi:ubiquinone/menaquinone biosynthesis C-methylase UbiE
MSIKEAYNNWASQYDTNKNHTRDLEGVALRSILKEIPFSNCLEIGCGTGKNTEWLLCKATSIMAVDFSDNMLAIAKEKIQSSIVNFVQTDITQDWNFTSKSYDLVVFSLVLEHIENLDFIFAQAAQKMTTGGYVYIGELHPFKQYTGSKARFETVKGTETLSCFTHHISEFVQVAQRNGLSIIDINEFFDDNDTTTIPRILSLVLQKK